jgi:hypothetical protein
VAALTRARLAAVDPCDRAGGAPPAGASQSNRLRAPGMRLVPAPTPHRTAAGYGRRRWELGQPDGHGIAFRWEETGGPLGRWGGRVDAGDRWEHSRLDSFAGDSPAHRARLGDRCVGVLKHSRSMLRPRRGAAVERLPRPCRPIAGHPRSSHWRSFSVVGHGSGQVLRLHRAPPGCRAAIPHGHVPAGRGGTSRAKRPP